MSSKAVRLGGTYRHYKGKMYKVHQVVRHSETLEELVFYECLYDSPGGQWWVRPLAMFTGTVIVEGVEKPRFELLLE
ncbi:MAG: DUF1653 domain-containing protein [Pseudobdellovibrionaceae bacterium]